MLCRESIPDRVRLDFGLEKDVFSLVGRASDAVTGRGFHQFKESV